MSSESSPVPVEEPNHPAAQEMAEEPLNATEEIEENETEQMEEEVITEEELVEEEENAIEEEEIVEEEAEQEEIVEEEEIVETTDADYEDEEIVEEEVNEKPKPKAPPKFAAKLDSIWSMSLDDVLGPSSHADQQQTEDDQEEEIEEEIIEDAEEFSEVEEEIIEEDADLQTADNVHVVEGAVPVEATVVPQETDAVVPLDASPAVERNVETDKPLAEANDSCTNVPVEGVSEPLESTVSETLDGDNAQIGSPGTKVEKQTAEHSVLSDHYDKATGIETDLTETATETMSKELVQVEGEIQTSEETAALGTVQSDVVNVMSTGIDNESMVENATLAVGATKDEIPVATNVVDNEPAQDEVPEILKSTDNVVENIETSTDEAVANVCLPSTSDSDLNTPVATKQVVQESLQDTSDAPPIPIQNVPVAQTAVKTRHVDSSSMAPPEGADSPVRLSPKKRVIKLRPTLEPPEGAEGPLDDPDRPMVERSRSSDEVIDLRRGLARQERSESPTRRTRSIAATPSRRPRAGTQHPLHVVSAQKSTDGSAENEGDNTQSVLSDEKQDDIKRFSLPVDYNRPEYSTDVPRDPSPVAQPTQPMIIPSVAEAPVMVDNSLHNISISSIRATETLPLSPLASPITSGPSDMSGLVEILSHGSGSLPLETEDEDGTRESGGGESGDRIPDKVNTVDDQDADDQHVSTIEAEEWCSGDPQPVLTEEANSALGKTPDCSNSIQDKTHEEKRSEAADEENDVDMDGEITEGQASEHQDIASEGDFLPTVDTVVSVDGKDAAQEATDVKDPAQDDCIAGQERSIPIASEETDNPDNDSKLNATESKELDEEMGIPQKESPLPEEKRTVFSDRPSPLGSSRNALFAILSCCILIVLIVVLAVVLSSRDGSEDLAEFHSLSPTNAPSFDATTPAPTPISSIPAEGTQQPSVATPAPSETTVLPPSVPTGVIPTTSPVITATAPPTSPIILGWELVAGPFSLALPGSGYGKAVAMSKTLMTVGAPEALSGTGAVLSYTPDESGGWISSQALYGEQIDSGFGSALDIDGSALLVGAPRHSNAGISSGGAFYFEQGDQNFVQVGKTIVGNTETSLPGELFGSSVAVSKNRISVIGAPGNSRGGETDRGAFYIFEYLDALGEWVQQEVMIGLQAGDRIGQTVDIEKENGNLVAVGSPGNDPGYLVIYERTGSSWTNTFLSVGERGGEAFGSSVKVLSPTLIAVGSPFYNVNQGRISVFEKTSRGFERLPDLVGQENDMIGSSGKLSGSGTTIVVAVANGVVKRFDLDRISGGWIETGLEVDTGYGSDLLSIATSSSSPHFVAGGNTQSSIYKVRR